MEISSLHLETLYTPRRDSSVRREVGEIARRLRSYGNIRRLLQLRGWQPADLVRACGEHHRANVSRLCAGTRRNLDTGERHELDPRMATVRRIANAFLVSERAVHYVQLTAGQLRGEMSRGALEAIQSEIS